MTLRNAFHLRRPLRNLLIQHWRRQSGISTNPLLHPHRRPIPVSSYTSYEDEKDEDIPRLPDPRIQELTELLKPLIVQAPEAPEITAIFGQRPRQNGLLAKERRAAPAIALHNEVISQPDLLSIYTDASLRYDALGGVAAWIPSINRLELHYMGFLIHVRKTVIAELAGMVLGLQMAVQYARPGQKVALFTDCQFERKLDRFFPIKEEVVQKAYAKADVACKELAQKDVDLRLYWVPGHREAIDGIAVADRAASEAARPLDEVAARFELSPHTVSGVAFEDCGVVSRSSRHLYLPFGNASKIPPIHTRSIPQIIAKLRQEKTLRDTW